MIDVHQVPDRVLDNYNERLFNGKNFRSRLHISRYLWLQKKIEQYKCNTSRLLELGCFDGKTIEFLKKSPEIYEGYDANWEGGLNLGIKKWQFNKNYHFNLCNKIDDFTPKENFFDISVCQETLEHLPLLDLDIYIERLARATKSFCFISVPNETGIVFLAKYLSKLLMQKKTEREHFTFAEIVHATLGNMKKVQRNETMHKGFDYKELQIKLAKYFDVVEINGLPVRFLPSALNFTVSFICKKKIGV